MNGEPIAFTDWRIAIGSHLPRGLLILICAAAGFAMAFSAVSLFWERRRGRAALLLGAARGWPSAACLLVALQPMLELGQVTRVPNHVAVLVDSSRSMMVRPPDGKERYLRAADAVEAAGAAVRAWRKAGHQVDLFTLRRDRWRPPTSRSLRQPPQAEATRIGETPGRAARPLRRPRPGRGGHRLRRHRHRPGGPRARSTARPARPWRRWARPCTPCSWARRELRDLSVAAVLADDFAFVRTPSSWRRSSAPPAWPAARSR